MNSLKPMQHDFTLALHGLQTPLPAPTAARLLLVDDEPLILASLRELLRPSGYELAMAVNGAEAIEQLSHAPFDLVILDLRLPDMGGHAIMDFINQRQIDTKVIVTSGDQGIDAAIGALKRDADDYLRKPYSREELLKAIHNVLQQHRLEAENRHIARKLESSERIYRYLVDSSPDIIFTLNPAGQITFINDRVLPLLGFQRDDLLGHHYSELVNAADIERADYVFGLGRRDQRWSRSIELRLKSFSLEADVRTFSIELMTIAEPLSSVPATATLLQPEILGIYAVARDITERKRADALVAYQAYHDILTNLPNRVLFKDRLSLALLQAKRKNSGLAVIFINLDRFKVINDSLGQQVGDELLQKTALRLQACLRHSDTLSRFASDEFNAVLPELQQTEDAAKVAKAFLASLKRPFALSGQSVHVSASIGVAIYPTDGQTVDELIRHSDLAMHSIKNQGRNGHAFFDRCMLANSAEQITLEHDLHMALSAGELEMYYQPQVNVNTGRIMGAEALMRWNHPKRGFLGAGEFLPFAEESGLIMPISDWMLEAVCRDLTAWNALGGAPVYVSINLSPHYLDRGDYVDKLKNTLDKFQIAPAQLEVEVTENICIRNPLTAIEQLNKLCQLGIRVAIDDFGTGYSSLSYLHRFPIHILKIDRSFIMPIEDESLQFPVVLAIISIAKGLGLKLIAEGVETEVQKRYLQRAGCDTIQGYYFYRPMQQGNLLALLQTQLQPSQVG